MLQHIPLNFVKAEQHQMTKADKAEVHKNDAELDYGQLTGIPTQECRKPPFTNGWI